MLSLEITPNNTVLIKWKKENKHKETEGQVEISSSGQVIRSSNVIREKMPEDFDIETEKLRMRNGGCCGKSLPND